MNFLDELPDIERDALEMAERALAEDGASDVTSEVVGAAGVEATGVVEFRSGGVVAGCAYADAVVELSAADTPTLTHAVEKNRLLEGADVTVVTREAVLWNRLNQAE